MTLSSAPNPQRTSATVLGPGALPAGFRSEFAELGDVTLHYVIGGEGPPVVLVHGWPQTWFAWRKVMPLLAQHHTVVAVDYRGAGESSIPKTGYDRKTISQDIHALLQRLNLSKVVLAGHDWGAAIGYALAAGFPTVVESLIAVDGFPLTSETKLDGAYWWIAFQAVPGLAEKVLAGHEREYMDWLYRNVTFLDEEGISEYERVFSQPARLKAGFELYRTFEQDVRDNTEFARTPLTIPVLAIGASRALGLSVAENMKRVASNVTSVVMQDTFHFIPDERPKELSGLIRAFLAGEPLSPIWAPGQQ